ncbi:MAG: hypothetical protein ACJA2P_000315 [Rhodoferax sp.]|jgi:hypothetical protein
MDCHAALSETREFMEDHSLQPHRDKAAFVFASVARQSRKS